MVVAFAPRATSARSNAQRTADYVRMQALRGEVKPRRATPRARYPELIESDYARRLVEILQLQRARLQPLLAELPALTTRARQRADAADVVERLGLRIVIEQRAGEIRRWVDSDGTRGQTTMRHDYGYLVGFLGADGEDVDVYLGPERSPTHVFVVHQQRKSSGFRAYDEDKVMLGWPDESAARAAYLAQYDDPRFLGSITTLPVDAFRRRLRAATGRAITATVAWRSDVGEGKRVHALLDRVRDTGSAARRAEESARAIAARVSTHGRRELDRQTGARLGVVVPVADARVPSMVEAFVAENVSLVRSLATRQLDELEKLIVRAFAANMPWTALAPLIEERFAIGERHARLIARDQVSKLNAQLARARHQELGLHAFRWYAMMDPRTRPSHAAKHGKLWAYEAGHGIPVPPFFPGEEVCCRCGELPAFDAVLELLDGPKLPSRARDIVDETEVRSVPARVLLEHGYYEPIAGLDSVKLAKAHASIAEGQTDPVTIVVGTNGRYELTDGRHRLRAASDRGENVLVQFQRGTRHTGTAKDLVFRSRR